MVLLIRWTVKLTTIITDSGQLCVLHGEFPCSLCLRGVSDVSIFYMMTFYGFLPDKERVCFWGIVFSDDSLPIRLF